MSSDDDGNSKLSKPMSPEEYDKFKEKWDTRLASGEPMVGYLFDETTDIKIAPTGEMQLDCPCFALAGFDRAGTVRVTLTKEAAQNLRRGLHVAEKTLGLPPLEHTQPRKN